MKTFLIACSICFAASNAAASIITIDPNNFPLGTDLTHLFDGVTLAKVTNEFNTDGEDGKQNFQPIEDAAYATTSYHLESGLSIGGQGIEVTAYESCRAAGPRGTFDSCSYFDVLAMNFATSTWALSIMGAGFSDGPRVLAYDALGNQISFLPGEYLETLTPVAFQSSYQFNITINRPQNDIAQIVFGGVGGNATATKIAYHKVPAPSTLLIVSMGALMLMRRRHRHTSAGKDTPQG